MSRLFIADSSKTDTRALVTTAKLKAMSDIVTPIPRFLTWNAAGSLTIAANTVVSVGDSIFKFSVDTTFTVADHLDTGSVLANGSDYYVYICDPGDGTSDEKIVVSLNATFPTGYTAKNSRKIGGFHYGYYRQVDAEGMPINSTAGQWGTGWETAVALGIIDASIWTVEFRPVCSPEGMVYIGGGLWVDIYEASDDGAGGAQSKFGVTPLSGANGENWYTLNERALVSGKKLISYFDWCKAAFGAPQGDTSGNYCVSAASGKQATGSNKFAVSNVGCKDCAGNLWEITNEMNSYASYETLTWAWRNVFTTDYTTISKGYLYASNGYGLVMFVVGGCYGDGKCCGSRALRLDYQPYSVYTTVGARLGCKSL